MRTGGSIVDGQSGSFSSLWMPSTNAQFGATKAGRWYSGNGMVDISAAYNTDNLPVYYPANGQRAGGSGAQLQNDGINCYLWSNKPYSLTQGLALNTVTNAVYAETVNNSFFNMSASYPVRCIQE
jgi:hypothetical protein